METIFNKQTLDGLIKRIDAVSADSKSQWGKMNAYQMLKHCTMSEEMYLGKTRYDRLFIGRLFGKMALGGILKNGDPMKKNQPTHADMKITGSGDAAAEKQRWITLLQQYQQFNNNFVHPFFGKMTKDQVGHYVFKHTDHHLRQFGR